MKKIANTVISVVLSLVLLAGYSVPVVSSDDEYFEYYEVNDEQTAHEDMYYDANGNYQSDDEWDDIYDSTYNGYDDGDSQTYEYPQNEVEDEYGSDDFEYIDDDPAGEVQESPDTNTENLSGQEGFDEAKGEEPDDSEYSLDDDYELSDTVQDSRVETDGGNDQYGNMTEAIETESGTTVAEEALGAAFVQSGSLGSNITWALDDEGTLTISGNGAMLEFNNSSSYSWYNLRDSITKVIIEPGVTTIGKYAFGAYENLVSISLPNTLQVIGEQSLYWTSLKTVTIPGSVQTISKNVFNNCHSLSEVVLLEGTEIIAGSAFSQCYALKTISIPSTVSDLNIFAFDQCTDLESVNIDPNNPNYCSVEGVVFAKDMGRLLIFPPGKTGAYVVPDSVEVVGSYAFNGSKLQNIRFAGSDTELESRAFYECGMLTQIDFPKGLVTMEEGVVTECISIEEVTIPASVRVIKNLVFDISVRNHSYTKLRNLYFLGDAPTISYAFAYLDCTAWYPEGNETWTEDVMQNYGGTITWKPYKREFQVSLENESDAEQLYTGSEIRPVPIVKNSDGETVTENVDYTISYSDNIEPGTATITATGIGEYDGTRGSVTFEIIGANIIKPTFELSTDAVSYQNGSLGEKLQLTLTAENVLLEGEIDRLSTEQKNAMCFHVESIDFKIEGTPVAYFKEIGDKYTQEYSIIPLDNGLEIPIGGSKEFADFEILTNPPITITDPVQTAEISYTIKGSIDNKEIQVSDKKTVTFTYDFIEEDVQANHTNLVDEWVNNEGTLNSIRYLTNSTNFIHYLFVTEQDSGVGGAVTKTLSDLFYRGTDGRMELGADKLTVQEAEQILVDFLNESEEEVLSLTKTSECIELANLITEGFKEYIVAVSINSNGNDGIDFENIDENYYTELAEKLAKRLSNEEDIGAGFFQTFAEEYNGISVQVYNGYLKSVLFAEKVTQVLGDIGTGIKFLSVGFDILEQIEEIWSLQEADIIYIEMLDYIGRYCDYAPVRQAAKFLSDVINEKLGSELRYANESLGSVITETAEGVIYKSTPKLISSLSKTKNSLGLYTIAAELGYESGVLISNTVFHTQENQELKDRMRILVALGETLGKWVDNGIDYYHRGGALNRPVYAKQIAYGEHILIKTRKLGELTYRKLCENVSTESCQAYKVSMCINSTLETFETWMKDSEILDMVSVIGVFCPVDVDVCDEDGNILLTVDDGEVSTGTSGDINYWSIYNTFDDDYMKVFVYPEGKKYSLRCRGCGEGEVSAFYQEYDNEGCSHCITFNDIPVKRDTVISMDALSLSSEQFNIENDSGTHLYTYERTVRDTENEHSFTDWSIDIAPSCILTGIRSRTCTHCGKTVVEELPLTDHTWKPDYTVDVEPTDDKPGYKSIHCQICDTVKTGSVTEIPRLDPPQGTELVSTGYYGSNIYWTFDSNGKLSLYGSGEVKSSTSADYTNRKNPWSPFIKEISEIVFDDRITSIGDWVFYLCTNVERIQLPESLVKIGAYSFDGCESLSDVVFPESLASIGEYAFSGCASLPNVVLPETLSYIGQSAFRDCTSFTDISIPKNITNVEAYYGCNALTTVYIPETVKTVGDHAFFKCTNLETVILSEGIEEILFCAFAYDKNLIIEIPETVIAIDDDAFFGCISNVIIIGKPGSYANTYANEKGITFIEKHEHLWGDASVQKEATCSEEGYSWLTCTACGEKRKEIIPSTPHMWEDNYRTDKPATTEEEGIESIHCSVCGSVKEGSERVIPKIAVDITSTAEIAVADKTYTGSGLTPEPTVTVNGTVLKKGTDYTVSYKNNTNVGTATLTITGIGGYTGTITASFTIKAKSLKAAEVTGLSDKTYTGSAFEPKPVVTLEGKKLVLDRDYYLAYKYNVNVSESEAKRATVAVKGMGNYNDVAVARFWIKPASLAKADITGISSKVYTGEALTQSPVVKLNGKTLKLDTDYYLAYKNNINTGRATIAIKGKGNYNNVAVKYFAINPKPSWVDKLTTPKTKQIKITWGKRTQISGYQLEISTNKSFSKPKMQKNVYDPAKLSMTVTVAKANTTYYVRIRSFKKTSDKTYFSTWSAVKTVKTK